MRPLVIRAGIPAILLASFVICLGLGCNIRTEVRPFFWPEKKPPEPAPVEKPKGNRP